MSKITTNLVRILPASALTLLAGIASAQTTTPGTPTTALGGFSGENLLLAVFALALVALGVTVAYKSGKHSA